MSVIASYIEICERIKSLTEEKKSIEKHFVEEGFESEKYEGNNVKRIITNRVYLKKDVDLSVVSARFPQAIKTELDMDVLKSTPDAQEYLELRPSTSFRIFKLKDGGKDEDDF